MEEPQWLGDFDVELAEAENPFAADDRLGPGALQPVQDLVTGTVATSPWQFGQYDRRSSTWLSAAQRRHQHRRRSNALLGVASVDLSGPHEASPMPGMRTNEHKAHYFLVLTVRADLSVGYADSAVQTESNPDSDSQPADPMIAGSSESAPRSPLIYVALVHKKSDAAHAVMALIAQAQDEHGHMPQKLIFRLHSDKGQEFCAHSLEKFCAVHGIHKTTTQGYDPSSNGAGESAVGYIKRKARQLLTGARMPSSWWGMASLTAAHYSRCAAGLLRFPALPFGTRAMLVSDPAPRNAFLPRSLPCTIFCPSSRVPQGYLLYQADRVKEAVNVVHSDLTPDELTYVKMHVLDWAPPAGPLAPPAPETWDPRAPAEVGAGDRALDGELEEAPEATNVEERPEDPRMRPEEILEEQVDLEPSGLSPSQPGRADDARAFHTSQKSTTTSPPGTALAVLGRPTHLFLNRSRLIFPRISWT